MPPWLQVSGEPGWPSSSEMEAVGPGPNSRVSGPGAWTHRPPGRKGPRPSPLPSLGLLGPVEFPWVSSSTPACVAPEMGSSNLG